MRRSAAVIRRGGVTAGVGTLFRDNFVGGWNGIWTNVSGSCSISPAGYLYHPGDGNGGGGLSCPMQASWQAIGTYFEVGGIWMDQTGGTNWTTMKVAEPTQQALYNGVGAGMAVEPGGQTFCFANGGSDSGSYPTVSPAPGAGVQANQLVSMGVLITSSTSFDAYVNGRYVSSRTGTAALTMNGVVQIGGYNSVGAHIDYFRVMSAVPY